jgi:hypothetical protein
MRIAPRSGSIFLHQPERFVQGPACRSRRWLSSRSLDLLLLAGCGGLLAALIHPIAQAQPLGVVSYFLLP